MRLVRGSTAILSIGSLALAVYACETTRRIGGVQPDTQSPTITLTNTAGDTQDIAGGLRFNVQANDNLGLKTIDLRFSGGLNGVLDTIFTPRSQFTTSPATLTFGANSGNGGQHHDHRPAPPTATTISPKTRSPSSFRTSRRSRSRWISPTAGAVASQNRSIPVEVRAIQNSGIAKIGFLVNPRLPSATPRRRRTTRSVSSVPCKDTVDYTDTLTVLAATGTFDVGRFAEDSAGRRLFSNVRSRSRSSLRPTTSLRRGWRIKINPRVEVDDTVIVRATDAKRDCVDRIRVDTGPAARVLLKFDTILWAREPHDVTAGPASPRSVLPPGVLPKSIVVRGYACDAATDATARTTNTTTLCPLRHAWRRHEQGLRPRPSMSPAA